ncbi:hypothetical protein IMSAGC015_02351 [Lachnospiraceae bacterium]|nr:hypothetical protein IMSAGC015_02351 [Lachnospiraceae bacterium]
MFHRHFPLQPASHTVKFICNLRPVPEEMFEFLFRKFCILRPGNHPQCQLFFGKHLRLKLSEYHIRKFCLRRAKTNAVSLLQLSSIDAPKVVSHQSRFTPHNKRYIQASGKCQIAPASIGRKPKGKNVSCMDQYRLIDRDWLSVYSGRHIRSGNCDNIIFFKGKLRPGEGHLQRPFTLLVPRQNIGQIKGLCIHRPRRRHPKLLIAKAALILHRRLYPGISNNDSHYFTTFLPCTAPSP